MSDAEVNLFLDELTMLDYIFANEDIVGAVFCNDEYEFIGDR